MGRAHNLEVLGSNPSPAANKTPRSCYDFGAFVFGEAAQDYPK